MARINVQCLLDELASIEFPVRPDEVDRLVRFEGDPAEAAGLIFQLGLGNLDEEEVEAYLEY